MEGRKNKNSKNIRKMRSFFLLLHPENETRLRSLVNRASDSGSEGPGFGSQRGHTEKEENRQRFSSFSLYDSGLRKRLSEKARTGFCPDDQPTSSSYLATDFSG